MNGHEDSTAGDSRPEQETVEPPINEGNAEENELLDRLAEDYASYCRVGPPPPIEPFLAAYPKLAHRLRRLLSTVRMVERMKQPGSPADALPSNMDRLGEFRILRELGRGGMGVVFEAVQEPLGRHVALKVVFHTHLDGNRMARFQREANALALLHHTNIVPIYAFGQHEGTPYYAMQLIHGGGLDRLLRRWRASGPPPEPERWRFTALVGRQAADAIQYAHEQGVIHRDLKPSNILIDEHHGIWLTDFGLAKLVGAADLTVSGDVIGTLRYMAPEVLHGQLGPAADVYGLGMTLYELATLRPPYGELSPSALLKWVAANEPERPRRLEPAIPADLETIILKATAREPGQRYASAADMAEDLRRYLDDRPILARRANAFERAWRWSRRNRAVALLGAVAAASLLIASVVGWVGYVQTRQALKGEAERRREAEDAQRRNDANVSLSLNALSEIFDELASRDNIPVPMAGQPGRSRRPLGGPPGGGPGGGGPGGGGPGGGGPGAGIRRYEDANGDPDLLQSILKFYAEFASRNQTNARLQGEAARAHRNVALICRRLGRDHEADAAESEAIRLLTDLAKAEPENTAYQSDLIDSYLIVDPWREPLEKLGPMELKLREAQRLANQLSASTVRDEFELSVQRMLIQAKLAAVLDRQGSSSAAEVCYHKAIELESQLIESRTHANRTRVDRAATYESLGRMYLGQGRNEEALAQFELAAVDLDAVSRDREVPPSLSDRYENLALAFERLGRTDHAKRLFESASRVDRVPPDRRPGRTPRDESPGGR